MSYQNNQDGYAVSSEMKGSQYRHTKHWTIRIFFEFNRNVLKAIIFPHLGHFFNSFISSFFLYQKPQFKYNSEFIKTFWKSKIRVQIPVFITALLFLLLDLMQLVLINNIRVMRTSMNKFIIHFFIHWFVFPTESVYLTHFQSKKTKVS